MESKLAQIAERQLIDAARRQSPTQRLAAFVEHSRLVQQLYREGIKLRATGSAAKSREFA
jgi:hypothetical protein